MSQSPPDPIHLENRESEGARKFSPTAARNRQPILEVLSPLIPQGAHVLEIASGTGEHALHMCAARPDVHWQTSDPDAESRASQDSWASEAGGGMLPSLNIDTMVAEWEQGLTPPNLIYCANMIHIAPWEAAIGLAQGASNLLGAGQLFVLYGPFKEGAGTAQGNLDFDAGLKSRNAAWGVRDLDAVKHIFALRGFNLIQRTVMPKNNRILVFKRS